MSVDIELYIYNYKKLKNNIIKTFNLKDEKLLEDILLSFGTVVDNRYVILCNEFYGDGNPYYNVSHAIELAFNIDENEVFDCFCLDPDNEYYEDDDYKQEGISYAEEYEVLSSLGIEYDDE